MGLSLVSLIPYINYVAEDVIVPTKLNPPNIYGAYKPISYTY